MKKILFIAAIISISTFQLSLSQAQDAVYKLLKYEWTVNADGTSDYHYRHEVQILRNRALVAYADKGETFVVYNPDLEELTVNEVYTIQKDGTRVNMPQNAFVYQLPSQCADCGRFNHIRELAMIHTGMELGCTIVVDYTIHRQYSLLSSTLDLVRECPVERLEVDITVPEGQELNAQLNDPAVLVFKPTVEESATHYSLRATNVPQKFVDSYLPAKEALYPTLHFFNGVPEFAPAFDRNGLEESSSAAGLQMNGNDRESVVAIRDFVVDNIHLNDLEPAMLGYLHSTAAEVWQTGCGTATDKAVLLAAMLNEMGFNARVTGDNYDEVGVTFDTLEYLLDVRHKTPLRLGGEAKDEVTKYVMSPNNNELVLDTLEDGFYRMILPSLPGAPAVRATNLALTRTAPLQSSACELRSDITYTLPKGMKMVKGTTSNSITYEGVGSVDIVMKQSGKKLHVVRNLSLEQSIVPVSDYAKYRQLLTIWQGAESILLQSK